MGGGVTLHCKSVSGVLKPSSLTRRLFCALGCHSRILNEPHLYDPNVTRTSHLAMQSHTLNQSRHRSTQKISTVRARVAETEIETLTVEVGVSTSSRRRRIVVQVIKPGMRPRTPERAFQLGQVARETEAEKMYSLDDHMNAL